jgi:hypothetical protein
VTAYPFDMDFFEELKYHTNLNILSITSSPINFAEIEVCAPTLCSARTETPEITIAPIEALLNGSHANTEPQLANARAGECLFSKVLDRLFLIGIMLSLSSSL